MDKLEAQRVLEKYLSGDADMYECSIVESWYLASPAEREAPQLQSIQMAEKAVWKRLSVQSRKSRYSIRLIAGVATLIILFLFGGYLFTINTKRDAALPESHVHKPIKPGSNKAILTLANGHKIVLFNNTSGKIAEQAGVIISKSANGRLVYKELPGAFSRPDGKTFNTIETPAGGLCQVVLPDGSNIWLNASSSLRFPVKFDEYERRVELKGEAYFEVAKDKSRPFVLCTQQQRVTVLGTRFNVNAYGDEVRTLTTLLEGSVKVATKVKRAVFLKPGQQAVLTGKVIRCRHISPNNAVDWKNGLFVFDNEKIDVIMRRIARWYNVEVSYDGPVSDERFVGTISRYHELREVLNVLELTNLVHFKVEERRVIVMP